MSSIPQYFFDTETTGLDPDGVANGQPDRLIEIGVAEYLDGKFTGRFFHTLINPEREIPEEATRVHGYTWDMLRDKPKFAEVAQSFLDFVRGGELFAHNADFDSRFIVSELIRMGHPENLLDIVSDIQNTVTLFRKLNPGERSYSLDNVRKRLHLDLSQRAREGHGAILDSHQLAEAYYTMQEVVPVRRKEGNKDVLDETGAIVYDLPIPREAHQRLFDYRRIPERPPVRRIPADPSRPLTQMPISEEDQAAHQAYLASIHKPDDVPAVVPVAVPEAPVVTTSAPAETVAPAAGSSRFSRRP